MNLENGNKFTISTNSDDPSYIYIESVQLNGENLNRNFLDIKEILKGGILKIKKSNIPNNNWPKENYYTTAINKQIEYS